MNNDMDANNAADYDAIRIEKLIRDFLANAKLMQLATSVNNQPWMAHVWFSHDAELNLYFISRKDRRHSNEIRMQSKVAGGIVNPPFEGLGQKVRGLIFQGKAIETEGNELEKAYEYYKNRWSNVVEHVKLSDIVNGNSQTRFYKIIPDLYVLFDEVNFPSQPRQEFKLLKN